MSKLVAAVLVFVCSAAVLMLEILAGRLLAPYVGISLETYTSIIGTVLAGIAGGAWLGGRLADRIDPRRLLGPTVCLGGVLALCTVPIVRALGNQGGQGGRGPTLLLTFAGFFLPAVVLSAVTPMVVKLQLHDLHRTGGVVGRLSGISTLGALVGTFVTGYLLTATTPTRTTIFSLGITLIVVGIGLGLWLARSNRAVATVLIVLAVLGGAAVTIGARSHGPCQIDSAYFCIRIERDPNNPNGRVLWLDNERHSYVDLADPTNLEFTYAIHFSKVLEDVWPDHRALDALHIGGGGFTLPRYLAVAYPGTRSVVLEIDPSVLKVNRERLGLKTSAALQVHIGDARIGIRARASNSADLVVGDAFASLSVPWHLTTREFVHQVDRVLRPDGIYLMNVVDYPPFRFARSEIATLRTQFNWVAELGQSPSTFRGGNLVLIASDRRLFPNGFPNPIVGDVFLQGADLDRFVGGAPVIRDDYTPIDQWLDADKN